MFRQTILGRRSGPSETEALREEVHRFDKNEGSRNWPAAGNREACWIVDTEWSKRSFFNFPEARTLRCHRLGRWSCPTLRGPIKTPTLAEKAEP